MALIPAGIFEMGDHFSEGNAHELPVYTVTLDGFNGLHTWYYEPSNNSVYFFETSIPPAGSEVIITYSPLPDCGNDTGDTGP
mgnify:CR=1 FL=1